MRFTLPLKFGLFSLIITLAGVMGMAGLSYQSSDELLQRQALARLADEIAREKEVLKSKLGTLAEDVRFLSSSPATNGIIRSVHGSGFDDAENMTLELWRKRLETLFKTVLQQRVSYSQIRVIGKADGGRELVRVERAGAGVKATPIAELQRKGDRAYFKKTSSLRPDEIYFSHINLNREQGKISYPPETVLRAAVPIFDGKGEIFGIVIINVNFDNFASSLYEAPENIFYFLANEQGDYLIHPQSDKRLAFERNLRANYLDDFPKQKARKLNVDKRRDHLRAFYPGMGLGLALDRLSFEDWGLPNRFFTFGAVAKLSVLKEQSSDLLDRLFLLVALITVVLVLVTMVFARRITQPIRHLTALANRIAGGEVVEAPVQGDDEISQLAAAFNTMLARLSASHTELREVADSLEEQVLERTRDLVDANKEIRNFAYIVSHDLRSPLVSIQGFSGELKEDLADVKTIVGGVKGLKENQRKKLDELLNMRIPEALDFIDASAGNMDRLINSILNLSRVGRRDLKIEDVDSRKIIDENLKALVHRIEADGVKVVIGEMPVVQADALALEQIFLNLLDNAIKYLSPERPGIIDVSAEIVDKTTVFHFKDNGAGIAKGDIPLIFDLFKRVGEQETEGEGMGLNYVQTLVRRMGGRIWCDSELGKGSIFSFSLPEEAKLRASLKEITRRLEGYKE